MYMSSMLQEARACARVLRNTLFVVPNGRRVSRGIGFLGERPRQPSGVCALGFDPLRTNSSGWAVKAVGRAASFPSGAGRDRTGENVGLSPRRVKSPKPRDGGIVSPHRLLRGGGDGASPSPRGGGLWVRGRVREYSRDIFGARYIFYFCFLY